MRLESAAVLACVVARHAVNGAAVPTATYRPMTPTRVQKTILLTGKDLTLDQVVDVARNGEPTRSFGASPTAVWTACRAILPFNGACLNAAAQPMLKIAE